MTELVTNNAQTTLNGAINNSVGSLVVTSATGFPTTGVFRIIVVAEGGNTDEIMTVTAVAGTTFTVVRASEATAGVQSASAHGNGATIAHVLTAKGLTTIARPWLDTYTSPLDATFGDDFDESSLNARWTRHNISSGWETYQSGNGSYLQVAITSGTSDQLYTQDITGLTDFGFIASYTVFQTYNVPAMWGLFALASNGDGRGILWYNSDGFAYHAFLSAYVYNGFTHPQASQFFPHTSKVWFRIERTGTTITTWISMDGDNWGKPKSATDSTTFDRIAIGRVFGNGGGTEDYWLLDLFDRYL